MPDVEVLDIDTYTVGLDRARARLHAMEFALENMHDPLSEIIDDLHTQTDEQFASFGLAADTPWEPLEPSTIANKTRMGYPAPGWPLVATGELRESALGHGDHDYGETAESEASFGLEWDRDGWNIAALQQFGVPEREVNRRAYTRSDGTRVRATSYMWHLPARPMLVATERLLSEGSDRIVAHIFQPFDF